MDQITSTPDIKAKLTQELEGYFPVSPFDYHSVVVLVLYWEKADHPAYKKEAEQVCELFGKYFGYKLQGQQPAAIPEVKSELFVSREIDNLMYENDDNTNLLIIHYGGHGDRDDNGKGTKRSVWAARADGGPTVDWYNIQPRLEKAKSDVLIILDCCYAAQAGRGHAPEEPNRCELLAACAMGVPTPEPGRRSFTTAMIREMGEMLSKSNEVLVSELYQRLMKKESRLSQTPIHVNLSGASRRRTIRLQPHFKDKVELIPAPLLHQREYVTAKIVVHGPLSLTETYSDIAKWLKTDPPPNISAIEIENAVTLPQKMHDFVHETPAIDNVSVYDRLAEEGKEDIDRSWLSMERFFASISSASNSIGSAFGQSEAAFRNLRILTSSLHNSIVRSLLALPEFNEVETITKLANNKASQDSGLDEPLRMRQRIVDQRTPAENLKIDCMRFSNNSVSDMLDGTPVFIEYKEYIKDERFQMDQMYVERVQKLCSLLNVPTTSKFRTLKCRHWFDNTDTHNFGLVFEVPSHYDNHPKSLHDIIGREKTARPSLGQRFRIAYELALALEEWHTVDWVHQSISSPKVLFFPPKDKSVVWDYTSPFLGGFEYSRPSLEPSTPARVENFETNVYRHPTRQGLPSERFQKDHDLYSFGVLLLEIGLWQLAKKCFDPQTVKAGLRPVKLKEVLVKNAQTRLAHYMGKDYSDAAYACLAGDFGVTMDDKAQTELGKAFRRRVIDKLAPGLSLK